MRKILKTDQMVQRTRLRTLLRERAGIGRRKDLKGDVLLRCLELDRAIVSQRLALEMSAVLVRRV